VDQERLEAGVDAIDDARDGLEGGGALHRGGRADSRQAAPEQIAVQGQGVERLLQLVGQRQRQEAALDPLALAAAERLRGGRGAAGRLRRLGPLAGLAGSAGRAQTTLRLASMPYSASLL
jgi:hypothetical protein